MLLIEGHLDAAGQHGRVAGALCRTVGVDHFSPLQALLAAKAGAGYISPFVGRLDDVSTDGMELIQQIRTVYDNYGFETEILVASVRHPMHVVQAALIGADVCTIPFSVINQLLKHPLTEQGLAKFIEDSKKVPAAAK